MSLAGPTPSLSITPGVKFSIRMSALRTMLRNSVAARGGLQIDRHELLVRIQHGKGQHRAGTYRSATTHVLATRRLDLDHPRTAHGHQERGVGAVIDLAQIENGYARPAARAARQHLRRWIRPSDCVIARFAPPPASATPIAAQRDWYIGRAILSIKIAQPCPSRTGVPNAVDIGRPFTLAPDVAIS